MIPFDIETRQLECGTHQAVAVGASFETKPGTFSEIYFYDNEIGHARDGILETDTYNFQYMSDRHLTNFPPPSRRTKLKFKSKVQKEQKKRSRKRKADSDVLQFFSNEAVETLGNEDEEEEEIQEGWIDIDDSSLDPVEREERRKIIEEKLAQIKDVESSAMDKFLDYFLKPEFCNSSFIAHNSARVNIYIYNFFLIC